MAFEKTVRTDIRSTPTLKGEYAEFCEDVLKVTVSERTRYLWRQDLMAYENSEGEFSHRKESA